MKHIQRPIKLTSPLIVLWSNYLNPLRGLYTLYYIPFCNIKTKVVPSSVLPCFVPKSFFIQTVIRLTFLRSIFFCSVHHLLLRALPLVLIFHSFFSSFSLIFSRSVPINIQNNEEWRQHHMSMDHDPRAFLKKHKISPPSC